MGNKVLGSNGEQLLQATGRNYEALATSFFSSWSVKYQSLRGPRSPSRARVRPLPLYMERNLHPEMSSAFLGHGIWKQEKSTLKPKFPYVVKLCKSGIKQESNREELLCGTRATSWGMRVKTNTHWMSTLCQVCTESFPGARTLHSPLSILYSYPEFGSCKIGTVIIPLYRWGD